MKNLKHILHKKLKSNSSSISEVEPMLRQMRELIYFDDKVYHNIMVSLTEAVNNALIHGNKLNPQKSVIVNIMANENQIECIIEDEGSGFELIKVPDPRKPENLLKDNGRGVFIINSLASKVNYKSNENGTSVSIIFELK